VAKLINYQYVKNETDISPNVQDEELDSPIKRSEEMLAMVIGDGLYGELSSQNPNFAGANIALMPYVKKFLAWQAYQFWLPKANFKTHNSGLRVHREDNSEPATDAQMATLIRLVAHLDLNNDSFPLYDFHCNTNKRTGTGFHITAVGGHGSHCGCYSCRHGHSQ
jgi:hypothetical protein